MLDKLGNVMRGAEIDREVIDSGLAVLTRQVRETWLATDYPKAMRSDGAQFRHACLHATKAIGKITALIDHADHERLDDPRSPGREPRAIRRGSHVYNSPKFSPLTAN